MSVILSLTGDPSSVKSQGVNMWSYCLNMHPFVYDTEISRKRSMMRCYGLSVERIRRLLCQFGLSIQAGTLRHLQPFTRIIAGLQKSMRFEYGSILCMPVRSGTRSGGTVQASVT